MSSHVPQPVPPGQPNPGWSATQDVRLSPPPAAPEHVGSRPWVHLLLLMLTFATTTFAGATFYANFITAIGTRPFPPQTTFSDLYIGGLWFSVPALLILGAHEMGHYVACRYYRIPATLPYFIPAPGLVGTFGAVIRMAVPHTRKALFDIGIAGPIAGFLVLIPVALFGVAQSFITQVPPGYRLTNGTELGDPLLLTLLQQTIFPPLARGQALVMHPAGFAAWFGLMATVLNLFPAGQLDGGHIVRALFGRLSRYVTLGTMLTLVILGVTVSFTWLFWGCLIGLMIYFFGLDHMPVDDEHTPMGGTRILLALFAVLIFVLSFTPVPISPTEFIGAR